MKTTLLLSSGRRKNIDRRLVMTCRKCGAQIESPPDEDIWFWQNGPVAQAFMRTHEETMGQLIYEETPP